MLRTRAFLAAAALVALAGCSRSTPQNAPDRADTAHMDAMHREHRAESPTPSAATDVRPRQEVTGSEVAYATVGGKQVRGYLARPAGAAPGAKLPAVVVIQEWWGLNDNIRAMARRLAGEGYEALAVDLYEGQVASDATRARTLAMALSQNQAGGMDNLRQAVGFLRARGAPKVGTVGWCLGGAWSLETALAVPGVDATVVYYGRPVTERERLAHLDAPLLGLYGAEDGGIPVAAVRQMEATLKELRKDVTVYVYEGADHAFANPSGQSYDATVAADAWGKTTTFLARHLQGRAGG